MVWIQVPGYVFCKYLLTVYGCSVIFFQCLLKNRNLKFWGQFTISLTAHACCVLAKKFLPNSSPQIFSPVFFFLSPCWESIDHVSVHLFLDSTLSHWCICLPTDQDHTCCYSSFLVKSWNRTVSVLQLCSSFSRWFWNLLYMFAFLCKF